MATNPTATQLALYYEALLLPQYQLPKAIATIGALAVGSDGQHGLIANALPNQVRAAFDLAGLNGNTPAAGQQLDFLGELIGQSRYQNGIELSYTFMAEPSYDDPDIGTYAGMNSYDFPTQPPSWKFLSYDDFSSEGLADGPYRQVLQFKAKVNGLWFSYGQIDALCYNFFGAYVNLKVTGNMEYTYQFLTTGTPQLFSIIKQMGLLPAPAGVKVIVQEVASFS